MAVAQLIRQYLTEREAAPYLGFKPATLRHSRWTGVLAGVAAPKHYKVGRSVRYSVAELDRWMDAVAKEVR